MRKSHQKTELADGADMINKRDCVCVRTEPYSPLVDLCIECTFVGTQRRKKVANPSIDLFTLRVCVHCVTKWAKKKNVRRPKEVKYEAPVNVTISATIFEYTFDTL